LTRKNYKSWGGLNLVRLDEFAAGTQRALRRIAEEDFGMDMRHFRWFLDRVGLDYIDVIRSVSP